MVSWGITSQTWIRASLSLVASDGPRRDISQMCSVGLKSGVGEVNGVNSGAPGGSQVPLHQCWSSTGSKDFILISSQCPIAWPVEVCSFLPQNITNPPPVGQSCNMSDVTQHNVLHSFSHPSLLQDLPVLVFYTRTFYSPVHYSQGN